MERWCPNSLLVPIIQSTLPIIKYLDYLITDCCRINLRILMGNLSRANNNNSNDFLDYPHSLVTLLEISSPILMAEYAHSISKFKRIIIVPCLQMSGVPFSEVPAQPFFMQNNEIDEQRRPHHPFEFFPPQPSTFELNPQIR